MAAYAAVASLMTIIEQVTNHPRLSTSLDNNQIQTLLGRAGFLLDFIEGCGGVTNKEMEDLERRITSAAHAAEDVIESHIVDQILAGSTKVSLDCSLSLQQIVEDMDGISREANDLKEKREFGEEQATHSRRSLMETVMVGFEEELNQLQDKLTSQQSSRLVISIVGMGGMGKSTLAHNLYQNLLIKQHFDIRAWATVSQQYNVKKTLSQLIGHGNSSSTTIDDLGLELHKALYGRRYLIVLDDVWNVEARDELMRFFPDNGNRSCVVLTTRLSNIAGDTCYDYCLAMKPLDECYHWELFCRKAFQQENCPYPQLERVGREITRLCRGLPLSIVVMGGLLLNSPRSLQFWENVASNIKSNPDSKEKEESLDILSLSYNHLPPRLKSCFLYMGTFKEDSEIRVSNIIKLWIAEGFLRPKKLLSLEEVAEGYLEELRDRNLISISKRRKNGKMGSFRIHDLMRELCLKVGQQHEFFHVLPEGQFHGSTERRLICPTSELRYAPPLGRSILALRVFAKRPARCKLLRVCNTEDYTGFPENLGANVNLRYIALLFRTNKKFISEIPSSISLVWNLQTLLIRAYYCARDSIVFAPIEIWKMPQLKHIQCPKIYVPSDGLFIMMDKLQLQTLKTAVNLRLSEQVCEMIPNIKNLRLLYHGKMHGYDGSLIGFLQNLYCLHKLESLNLSFLGFSPLSIESGLNKKLAFPASLNKLSLGGCRLRWEDLSMVGSLPRLQVLELGINSVTVGNNWSPIDEQFTQLKFLKIDWCHLVNWEADESHFPALEKLILGGLRNLEEIPSGIGEIPTLELIRVEYCSESAAISAAMIKKVQWENQGDSDLQVQVRIFD